jgi:NADP-dependent aldehyde dehydrogenase
LPASRRAEFLAIAEEIDALGDEFVAIVCRETALPAGRIQGERGRTSGQMRLFAQVLRRGDFYGARIDQPCPTANRCPALTCANTASASARSPSSAPVTFRWRSPPQAATPQRTGRRLPGGVQAHSGHMATAEWVAQAIIRAAERTGMPAGVFNMIYGAGVGATLVKHPAIQQSALPARCRWSRPV